MYQFGQGVQTDNGRALAWNGLATDRGSIQGSNNLETLTDDLEDDDGNVQDAPAPVGDVALAEAQGWVSTRNLRGQIDQVKADALYQDDLVDQLEHTGKGKTGVVVNTMNALGSAIAVKYRAQAQKDRAEAAQLRDELAQAERQSPSSMGVPGP